MIAEDHGAQVTCSFCHREYDFNEEELKKLLDD